MKKILIIIGCVSIVSCKKYLDRQPLDTYSSSTFLVNEDEMKLALTGVYSGANWNYTSSNVPVLKRTESCTDLSLARTGDADDAIALGDNGPFVNGNALVSSAWSNAYTLVNRSNNFLEGITKGKDKVAAANYDRMRAEALVLRAWAYYHLMAWFGDPIFFTEVLEPDEIFAQKRVPMAEVAKKIYTDLDEAWAALPNLQERGRVNKGVAYGIKAKIALLIKDYATAAAASKAVIDLNAYKLNPKYTDLFLLAGQSANVNNEIMFVQPYPTDIAFPVSYLSIGTTPRQVLGTSGNNFPTQQLVDKYECIDGKRIDESPLYDPANPYKNRDARLRWTVFTPGDTMDVRTTNNVSAPYQNPMQRIIYNIYIDKTVRFNWNTNKYDSVAGNIDFVTSTNSLWQFGSTGARGGVGYSWRKYIDPSQDQWSLKTGFINMRYAEILLMYAEAKIELNQLDASVTDAINLVRRRAGQPDIILAGQDVLRKQVRRERAVEFAMEGLRFIDLRRWNIYLEAMNGPIVGAAKNPTQVPAIPNFNKSAVTNANDIPDYSSSSSLRISSRNQTRLNTTKHMLWPIPQGDIDKNNGISQNPGW